MNITEVFAQKENIGRVYVIAKREIVGEQETACVNLTAFDNKGNILYESQGSYASLKTAKRGAERIAKALGNKGIDNVTCGVWK